MRSAAFSLIAMLVLLSATAAGCNDVPITQETIDEAVHKIARANREVETATFDLSLSGMVTTGDGTDTRQVLLYGDGTGSIDNATQRMHLSMTMRSKAPGQAPVDQFLEYYIADGWLYMSSSSPEEKPRWIKMQMPPQMWQNQAEQQVDMLRSATEVSYLGMEDVDGAICHVIRIVPGRKSIRQVLEQTHSQFASLGVYGYGPLDPEGAPPEVSVTQYVAADTYLFMRTDQQMVIEMTPEAASPPASAENSATLNLSTTIVFRNYDEPVTIQVPQGSLAAIEIE